MSDDWLKEKADAIVVSDHDALVLIEIAKLMERHNLISIKTYEGKWVFQARVGETTAHYRCRLQSTPFDALRYAIAGRDAKEQADVGKLALREAIHSGLVEKADLEWAISRFNEQGTFQR